MTRAERMRRRIESGEVSRDLARGLATVATVAAAADEAETEAEACRLAAQAVAAILAEAQADAYRATSIDNKTVSAAASAAREALDGLATLAEVAARPERWR